MADKKKKISAATKKAAKNLKAAKSEKLPREKKPNAFVRGGGRVKKFFRDVKGECKKVVWPDRKMVLKSTLIVIVSIAVIGVVIALIDLGLSQTVKALVSLAKGSDKETAEAVVGAFTAGFFLT